MADLDMKSRSSQRSRNVLALVLGGVVVLLLIIGGWYIWYTQEKNRSEVSNLQEQIRELSNNDTNTVTNTSSNTVSNESNTTNSVSNTTSNTTTNSTTDTTTTPTPIANYQSMTNDTFGYTFQFPKNWFWHKLSTTFFSMGAKEADLAIPNSDYTGKMGLSVVATKDATPASDSTSTVASETVTINGMTVKKYTITYTADAFGGAGKLVEYAFPLSNSKTLLVTDKDDYQKAVFDNVVHSISVTK